MRIPGISGAVIVGLFAIIMAGVRACGEDQSWCTTVAGVCDVESTRQLCPNTCNTCLPNVCLDCTQNCTTFHEGKEYRCTCNKGFKLQSDGTTCTDIDECQENSGICGQDLVCKNNDGSYECIEDKCRKYLTKQYIRSYSYPDQCCKMSKGSCGQNNQNLDGRALRIYGGDNASAGMWPWHATITTKEGLCGGSLISDRWVVTAAQCFRTTRNRRRVNFDVTFGSVERNKVISLSRQRRTIIEVIKYGSFRFPMHDIALAKLDRRIQVSEFVRPVCLPNGEIPKDGTRCYSTGFGVTDPGKFQPADVLQQVDLQIVDTRSCKDAYKDSGNSVNVKTMMCGGGNSGKNTCMGDSGGPLVCQRCNSCDWFLAGITSFGSKCGSSNRPGVYTSVEYYENWISRWTSRAVKVKKAVCKPVQWSSWGRWTTCSKTCRGGGQTRIRICSDRSATGLPGCLGKYFDRRVCSTTPCGVGPWAKWTDCSKSCDGGVQTRTTTCKKAPCEKLSERKECNTQLCPQWNRWSQWSTCSKSCGGGSRTRTRTCDTAGTAKCSGQTRMIEKCNGDPCPSWGDWSQWQKCSHECGGGAQTSARRCVGGQAGVDCLGRSDRVQDCNKQACRFTGWGKWTRCSVSCGPGTQERERTCPRGSCKSDEFGTVTKQTKSCNIINCVGKWSKWTTWNECSQSCGGGLRKRTRLCKDGLTCLGEITTEEEECNVNECAGTWTKWTTWSQCDATCGDGHSSRSRKCNNGKHCPGEDRIFRDCSLKPCSTWSSWSTWSECDVTCGPAVKQRDRTCQHGTDCPGDPNEFAECLTIFCPAWSSWSSWTPCNSTCGEGNTNRQRACENGPGCVGEKDETTTCTSKPCPIWSDWSLWTPCQTTCGEGSTSRERTCENGPGCTGDAEQSRICFGDPCSLWSDWSQWSTCDASCGEGNRIRTRACENGDDCPGIPDETEPCQLKVCPSWSDWSEWSLCSKTCGNGNETRTRTCENSTSGDDRCEGDKQETKTCATEACPSQCSYLCIERVKNGGCRLNGGEWISRICHSDCCGPAHCRDELPSCPAAAQAGYCRDLTWFQNCVASCGYCPQ